ncbi:hypothetical protein Ae201684P_019122 [Aphanomyces euteiches]|nr:hypothetical protein Ae201684P_019122 [Aphanomyces euteiches]
MHLDDEGAVAKAVTSLLGRPAEWAHGQLSLNSNCFPDLDTFFAALKAFLAPPDSDFWNRTLFHKSVQGKLSIRDYANRLRYIYTLMIDRDSLNEATRVSVFMNGLVGKAPHEANCFAASPRLLRKLLRLHLRKNSPKPRLKKNRPGPINGTWMSHRWSSFHNAKRIACLLRPRRLNGLASSAISLVTLRATVHAAGARPACNKRRRVTQRLRLRDKRSRRVALEDPLVRREARTVG